MTFYVKLKTFDKKYIHHTKQNNILYHLTEYHQVGTDRFKSTHLYTHKNEYFRSSRFVDYRNIRLKIWKHFYCKVLHDDVIKWKHFPRYWPCVRGLHRSPVNSTHKGQWGGALMFCLICVWINGWVNNREAGDLRRHRAHYDVIVMILVISTVRGFSWVIHSNLHT